MADYITVHEYEKNVNPIMNQIPIRTKNITECDYGMNYLDNSELFNVPYESTSPNLLAGFIKIRESEIFPIKKNNAASNLFFIIQGECDFFVDGELISLNSGDIVVTPYFRSIQIINTFEGDLQMYHVNDSALLRYLGSTPTEKIFRTAKYSKTFLVENLERLSNPENNRKGILLSNKDTEILGTNTITPVLWALYNELPPNTVQKPHRHNSVALDLCISCSDSENIYTLVGEKLDDKGNIIDPKKVHWRQNEMFITPPGLWHSHNNTGNTFAYILPIQDAGILLYQRILGIELLKI
jgi:gentisate 1,2-dioxygenase